LTSPARIRKRTLKVVADNAVIVFGDELQHPGPDAPQQRLDVIVCRGWQVLAVLAGLKYPELMGADDGQDLDSLVAELKARQEQLVRELPDMDPDELFLILHSLLRPIGTGRRFFLRRQADGTHVF
jgi:hypothetical protein